MITIIDYGMGNIGSVLKALKKIKAEAQISRNIDDIARADKLILPGVGHFKNGMQKLSELKYMEILESKVIDERTPILGICLGMQLFARHSDEGDAEGLGWLNAEVKRFEPDDTQKFKVPHMGWNSVRQAQENVLIQSINQQELFYFVHSYYVLCHDQEDVLSTTKYEIEFTSAVHRKNIYGTQFHPEKSHDKGLAILSNFAHRI